MNARIPLTVALALGIVGAAIAPAAAHPVRVASLTPTIDHVVVIVQENHSFDSYFAGYCQQTKACNGAKLTANPQNPYTPLQPVPLVDATTMVNDPNHEQACELAEMAGGKMDGYTTPNPSASQASGLPCGSPLNFAEAPAGIGPATFYQDLARRGALADNYFQPIAGASSSNDMYLWSAQYAFTDNTVEPKAMGDQCSTNSNRDRYDDATHPNLGSALDKAKVSWAWYAEGYDAMTAAAATTKGTPAAGTPAGCPVPPVDCNAHVPSYPCVFDPSDLPPEYYASSVDNPTHIKDYAKLAGAISSGDLPAVTYVKGLGYHSEHPGYGTTLTAGVDFVQQTIDAIEQSKLAKSTLILITWDESGGYFDHVKPPSSVENYPGTTAAIPYGPRVPLMAVGPLAARGTVSDVRLEHSSIVKFIEWRWLDGTTLGGREAKVHNIGSLLRSGLNVPS